MCILFTYVHYNYLSLKTASDSGHLIRIQYSGAIAQFNNPCGNKQAKPY